MTKQSMKMLHEMVLDEQERVRKLFKAAGYDVPSKNPEGPYIDRRGSEKTTFSQSLRTGFERPAQSISETVSIKSE